MKYEGRIWLPHDRICSAFVGGVGYGGDASTSYTDCASKDALEEANDECLAECCASAED
jgi:hypothetical protein